MAEHPLVRERCGGNPGCDALEYCATRAIPAGPLRELGSYLARVLDEDQWAHAESLLLKAAAGVSALPAGHWRCACGTVLKGGAAHMNCPDGVATDQPENKT